jgi:hypothetical protein
MDFVIWFFVESKTFELSIPAGGSILRLVERRNGISRVMMVGKYCVEWLKKAVERMVLLDEDQPFTESSRDGNKAFFAQRGVNHAGCFLELAEYSVGGPKGLIIVPEGRDKRGWKRFAEELGKVLTAFVSFSRKPESGCSQPPLFPLSGKKSAGSSSYGGLHPSFAEVVSAAAKPGVPSGQGEELHAIDRLSKTQISSEAALEVRVPALSSSGVAAPSSSRVSESALGLFGPGQDWVGQFWAWKARLEGLKGEVERALHCVYVGLGLIGPGKDLDLSNPKSLPKSNSKFKPKSKKGVKLRHLSLLRKPKPISKRLDFVSVQESFHKPKTHFSKVGSSSPVVSLIPNASPKPDASPEVFLFADASPEEVLLPLPKSEAVRRCSGEGGGSLALLPRPEVSPITTELLPGQCLAPKPLKFYNRKSKVCRLSNMNDNLIAEAVSAISGAAFSLLFGGSQTSSEVVLVPANNVPPTRGFLRRGFLKPSSLVVIRDCLPEPPDALAVLWSLWGFSLPWLIRWSLSNRFLRLCSVR